MKPIISLLAAASLILTISSCKKNNPEPEVEETPLTSEVPQSSLLKLGETYIMGASAKAVVYGTKTPETGYNEIFVAMFDSIDGSKLDEGHFNINPMMDMVSMKHSAPAENNSEGHATSGYYKCAVVFSMSGNVGQWWLEMTFHNHKNNKQGTGKLALNVKASTPSKCKSTWLAGDNGASVYLSLLSPLKPIVGINDFELVLHKKINTMEYAPVDDYKIVVEPVMPSMGHGSPNNVDPILTSRGHYKGKVNFTMSGLWHIKLKLFKNDSLLSDTQFFEITID